MAYATSTNSSSSALSSCDTCLIKSITLYKLKSKKKDFSLEDLETVLYSLVVGSLIAPKSPLVNLFFNPSFSLLPNLLSSNML